MGTLAFVMWLGMNPWGMPESQNLLSNTTTVACCDSASGICKFFPGSNSAWKPLVVPAIQKKDWTFNEDTYYWDCEDKTRILEHDEQNPPKYWCRAGAQ